MPITVSITVPQLKALFESGDKPTAADFATLIESTYGRDQVLQFNPVSGDLGISTSDGGTFNIVNIANMLDANLSFAYSSVTRILTVTSNGNAIPLGPFDGPWTVTPAGNKAHTTRWIGVGVTNPGYPLHVIGNAKIEGKTTVTGDFFADKDVQIQDGLRFGGHAEEVDRITEVISLASSSNRALTTEKAVIDFVRKYSEHHALLWNLSPRNIAVSNAAIPLDASNVIIWDSTYAINPSNELVIPSGAGGMFRVEVFFSLQGLGNSSGDQAKFLLRHGSPSGNVDHPILVLSLRHYPDAGTGAFELQLSGLDRISIILDSNSAGNNFKGRVSVKRLPDPIL
jgi:hypothetical protein